MLYRYGDARLLMQRRHCFAGGFMWNIFSEKFLSAYADRSFMEYRRAQILKYFLLLAFILLVITILMNTFVIEGLFLSMQNALRFVLISVVFVGLYFLRAGRYVLSSNLVLFLATAAICVLVTMQDYKEAVVLTTRLYYLPIFVVLAAVFCSRRSMAGCMVFLLIAMLYTVNSSAVLTEPQRVRIMTNFTISISFIAVLAFLLLTIVSSTIRKLQEGQRKEDEIVLMSRLIDSVREVSSRLSDSARKLSEENRELEKRTELQAESVGVITEAVVRTTGTVKETVTNTCTAKGMAEDSDKISNDGVDVVENAIQSMTDINSSNEKIGEILQLIRDISFQTNLLALNAAVEAARAGDAGRGFAVVAGEVRSLAQRSAASVKNIDGIIRETQERSTVGTQHVIKSGVMMKQITGSVKNVTGILTSITDDCRQLLCEFENIRRSIDAVGNSSEENRGQVKRTAEICDELTAAADELSALLHDASALQ